LRCTIPQQSIALASRATRRSARFFLKGKARLVPDLEKKGKETGLTCTCTTSKHCTCKWYLATLWIAPSWAAGKNADLTQQEKVSRTLFGSSWLGANGIADRSTWPLAPCWSDDPSSIWLRFFFPFSKQDKAPANIILARRKWAQFIVV
jgi:hypothetical protein